MTKPTLHIPQKDSPQSTLATGINDTETSLVLADSSIFEADAITRLTLGIDETATETVVVSSYDGDNTITVVRGTPSYAWLAGTVVARVLNSDDISEIHQYLDHLDGYLTGGAMVTNGDSHDHDGGDGAQIPEGGILNGAITTGKIAAGGVTESNIATGAVTINKIGADAIDGSKIADNAINSEHIYAGAIDTAHIGDSQITANKLATSAVIEGKIATGAVTVNKLASDSVTTIKIANSNVTDAKIDTVAASKVTGLADAVDTEIDSYHITRKWAIAFPLGNGSEVVETGVQFGIEIPDKCYIDSVSLLSLDGTSGSIVVDLWKSSWADIPADSGDTITASARPTLSSQVIYRDITLTGWTRTINAGDWLYVNVVSAVTVKIVILSITGHLLT